MEFYLCLIAILINGKRSYRINYHEKSGGNVFNKIIPGSTHMIKGLTEEQIYEIIAPDGLSKLPNLYSAESLLCFPNTFIEEVSSSCRRSKRIANKKRQRIK
jgi:hypothetical protein